MIKSRTTGQVGLQVEQYDNTGRTKCKTMRLQVELLGSQKVSVRILPLKLQ